MTAYPPRASRRRLTPPPSTTIRPWLIDRGRVATGVGSNARFTILRRDPDSWSTGSTRARRRASGSAASAYCGRSAVGVGQRDGAAGEAAGAVGDAVRVPTPRRRRHCGSCSTRRRSGLAAGGAPRLASSRVTVNVTRLPPRGRIGSGAARRDRCPPRSCRAGCARGHLPE